MYKWPVTYTDYNGVERSETFYFNLTKAELMEMELSTTGGLAEMLQGIIDSKDVPAIASFFKQILLKAYGVKSADGRLFKKNDELRAEFEQTEAFSEILMSLYTDADLASKFVNSIIPPDLAAKAGTVKLNAAN